MEEFIKKDIVVIKSNEIIKDKKSFFSFLKKYTEDSSSDGENLNNKKWIYRGVSSNHYKLIPSIGRDKHKKKNATLTIDDEKLIFRHFLQYSKSFIKENHDYMNLLAIAQHHGLPTRLLDWTFNPLVAAYFAVEKDIIQIVNHKKIKYSLIYVYEKPKEAKINEEYVKFEDIFVDKLEFFIPNHNHQRIINQNGLFTIHPYKDEKWMELSGNEIVAIPIKLSYRRHLRKLLNRLGVNQSTIYPGLDGVSTHIRWMETDYY